MKRVLSGKERAACIHAENARRSEQAVSEGYPKPSVAVVYSEDDDGIKAYIRGIRKNAEKSGFDVRLCELSRELSTDDVKKIMEELNNDDKIHAVLLEKPFPQNVDYEEIRQMLDPAKDAEGVTDTNIAALYGGKEAILPCTAEAVMEMLEAYEIPVSGKRAVVIGRSQTVGKPAAQLLLNKNATVTVAHSRTKNLPEITKEADILVVAMKRAKMIGKDYCRDGQVIIDVGTNYDENGKLCGDVNFEELQDLDAEVSVVPGGIGTLTTAILFRSAMKCYRRKYGIRSE
ncbi:MAG: bifunctional 5,10-methylenetetrahydrofolate dehydrogenase/5,10-methenyltetrahydrofolate cyclohydrolase [Erysipelotrichales bacterium]|nr:bifunctional 5,10-methylenetetrahydrofolate dehydrogenase/5,10-methenyltetrahydrofolate cyclohydrolase [Erysipelotrichales bacterium]